MPCEEYKILVQKLIKICFGTKLIKICFGTKFTEKEF